MVTFGATDLKADFDDLVSNQEYFVAIDAQAIVQIWQ